MLLKVCLNAKIEGKFYKRGSFIEIKTANKEILMKLAAGALREVPREAVKTRIEKVDIPIEKQVEIQEEPKKKEAKKK